MARKAKNGLGRFRSLRLASCFFLFLFFIFIIGSVCVSSRFPPLARHGRYIFAATVFNKIVVSHVCLHSAVRRVRIVPIVRVIAQQNATASK